MICNATVVLPLDSGPYISITLPLGTPPSPNAISRLNEPVGIASILIISYIVITIGKLSVPAYKQIVKMLYNHEHLFVINII